MGTGNIQQGKPSTSGVQPGQPGSIPPTEKNFDTHLNRLFPNQNSKTRGPMAELRGAITELMKTDPKAAGELIDLLSTMQTANHEAIMAQLDGWAESIEMNAEQDKEATNKRLIAAEEQGLRQQDVTPQDVTPRRNLVGRFGNVIKHQNILSAGQSGEARAIQNPELPTTSTPATEKQQELAAQTSATRAAEQGLRQPADAVGVNISNPTQSTEVRPAQSSTPVSQADLNAQVTRGVNRMESKVQAHDPQD